VTDQHGPPARVPCGDALDRLDDTCAERHRVDARAVEVAGDEALPARVVARAQLLDGHVRRVGGVELRDARLQQRLHREGRHQRGCGLDGPA
jgi:hypothetical protein